MAGIDKYFWRGIKEDMAKIVKMMASNDEFSHLDVPRVTAWICSDAVTIDPRMRTTEEILSSLIPNKAKYAQLFAEIGVTAQKDLVESSDRAMTKSSEVSARIVQYRATMEAERILRQAQIAQLKRRDPKDVKIVGPNDEVMSEDITHKVLESLSDPKVAQGKRFVLVGGDDKQLDGEAIAKAIEIVKSIAEYADNAVTKTSEHVSPFDDDVDVDVVEDTIE